LQAAAGVDDEMFAGRQAVDGLVLGHELLENLSAAVAFAGAARAFGEAGAAHVERRPALDQHEGGTVAARQVAGGVA
jgi:hypothetical protein